MDAVRKYLRDWAEPEAALAEAVDASYARALVVPACREEASLLEGYRVAARTSSGRTLCILVANGPDDASEGEHAESSRCLAATLASLMEVRQIGTAPRAFLGTAPRASLDVLVLDRASAGARVPRKEGVGLARKIGFDVALALHERGQVSSRLLFGTDADATLPEAFFEQGELEANPDVAAAVFPFWHTPSADAEVSRATAFYELRLRYYVAGLAWAGSPYAFHTLGSATAVAAEAYAAVRGAPKREAAEDFYLLCKIAKVGAIASAQSSPIQLRSRRSDRTPFGTGASVAATLASPEQTLYAPECFQALRETLVLLTSFAAHGDVGRVFSELARLPAGAREAVLALFGEAGAEAALEAASREAKTEEGRRRRVHSWFDAFRTLKLVHAVENAGAFRLPWRDAFTVAPFCEELPTDADDRVLSTLRVALAGREARPLLMGPCVPRPPAPAP